MSKKRAPQVPAKVAQPQLPNGQVKLAIQQQTWHGPIPSPDQLAQFNQVVPGAAERILKMAEAEGEHSRKTQALAVKASIGSQYLGQFLAALISGGGMYVADHLAMANHDYVAAIVASAAIGTIGVAFLQVLKSSKK